MLGLRIRLLLVTVKFGIYQFYEYYWDHLADWWDTQGWTREIMVVLPCVLAVISATGTFLVCWHWHRVPDTHSNVLLCKT